MDAAALLSTACRLAVLLARLASWPLTTSINALVVLLRPLYALTIFALLPFVHLAHAAIAIIALPFNVKWLEQIEVINSRLSTTCAAACCGCRQPPES